MIQWKHVKLSAWFSGALSVAAFVLSSLSFYVTGLRVTDDLRVVVGEMPFAIPDFAKKEFDISAERARYIFINAGSRTAIISGITLLLAQPQEGSELPASGCRMPKAHFTQYDLEPFVLRPGDMIAKDTIQQAKTTEARQKPLAQVTEADSVPFSDQNAKSKAIKFRMCIEVAFTTPSVESGVKTVNEFEDELDERVIGYGTLGSDKIIERSPVQLTKRNRILFFD